MTLPKNTALEHVGGEGGESGCVLGPHPAHLGTCPSELIRTPRVGRGANLSVVPNLTKRNLPHNLQLQGPREHPLQAVTERSSVEISVKPGEETERLPNVFDLVKAVLGKGKRLCW